MKGTHGTCVSRANRIDSEGFRAGSGLKGNGVYFWAYSRHEDLAKKLAVAWWRKSHKEGLYEQEQNTECAVFGVSLVADENRCLDFENLEVRETFIKFCEANLDRLECKRGITKEEKEADVYEYFVRNLSAALGVEFQVIKVKVSLPDTKERAMSIAYLGNPLCYVVKDVTCITDVRRLEV